MGRMIHPDLDLLIFAARKAAEIALPFWQGDHQVWYKPDDAGPVTEADLQVDQFLKEYLLSERPSYGWLSEETEDGTARLSKSRVFVVDPIDGTRAFTAGERTWAHSLAVVEDGVPVAGVVFLPVREKMFVAAQGQGAMLNNVPIQSSLRREAEGSDLLATRPTIAPENWTMRPEFKRHHRSSLAYRLSLVGAGRFDGMLTLRPTWEWDIAAGVLIASEAGASVTDRAGQTFQFNSPKAQTNGVVAGAPGVHSQLISVLAPSAT
jgi:myo-inositol-1(or 4)-monophosphatase